jgi:hypothetical protein
MKIATAPVSRRAGKTATQAGKATTGAPLTAKAPPRSRGDVDPAALLLDLRALVQSARQRLATVANATYTLLCWQIGRRLLRDNLQSGRAAYGKQILATVSQELTAEFGAGFNYTSLTRMARFAEWMTNEQILATLSQTLSWSHFVELLPIKDPLARDFYAEMSRIEHWDVRTLRQKIGGMLFQRTALSKRPTSVISAEISKLRDGQMSPRHRVPRPLPAGSTGPQGRLQRKRPRERHPARDRRRAAGTGHRLRLRRTAEAHERGQG